MWGLEKQRENTKRTSSDLHWILSKTVLGCVKCDKILVESWRYNISVVRSLQLVMFWGSLLLYILMASKSLKPELVLVFLCCCIHGLIMLTCIQRLLLSI